MRLRRDRGPHDLVQGPEAVQQAPPAPCVLAAPRLLLVRSARAATSGICTEAAPPPPPAPPPAHAYDRDASPVRRLDQVLFLRLRRGSGQRPYVQRGRLYNITVPFKTVKVGNVGPKKYFGMSDDVAVGLKHPLQCSLAPRAVAATFASTVSADFTSLSTLDQMDDGSYVDLLGRIVQIDATQLMNALPRKTVTIANGDYYGNVEFSGKCWRLADSHEPSLRES